MKFNEKPCVFACFGPQKPDLRPQVDSDPIRQLHVLPLSRDRRLPPDLLEAVLLGGRSVCA